MRTGFSVVERNWSLRRADARGEIDIIARREDLMVFCEVKARRSSAYGGASVAVSAVQQERLRLMAQLWLIEQDLGDLDIRFDVIAINGTELTHYEAAF